MALRNSIFAVSGKASFMDARRDMSGLFVCDKTTMLPIAGILDRSQDNLVDVYKRQPLERPRSPP